MEEKLRNIFTNVNDWLKFAETKNAALLAANAATIFGALQVLGGSTEPYTAFKYYLWEFIGCSVLASVILILSFLPVLKIREEKPLQPRKNENLLFYGDIARHSSATYLKAIRAAYNCESPELPIENHISEQIVVNSRIALRKFTHFQMAGWLTLMAVLTIPVTVALMLIRNNLEKQRQRNIAAPTREEIAVSKTQQSE